MLRLQPGRIILTKEDMESLKQLSLKQTHSGTLNLSRPSVSSNTGFVNSAFHSTESTDTPLLWRVVPARSRDASVVPCNPDAHTPSYISIQDESNDEDERASLPQIIDLAILPVPSTAHSTGDAYLDNGTSPSRDCVPGLEDHGMRTLSQSGIDISSLPQKSPLDVLVERLSALSSLLPTAPSPASRHGGSHPGTPREALLTCGVPTEQSTPDERHQGSDLLLSPGAALSGRFKAAARVYPREAYTTPRRRHQILITEDVLASPSQSTWRGSERYPGSTCSPLPDFNAMAIQEAQIHAKLSPARRLLDTETGLSATHRRSPSKTRGTPVIPVYDDKLPPHMQAQTPADIRFVTPGRRPLLRSTTRHAMTTATNDSPTGYKQSDNESVTRRHLSANSGMQSLRESASAHVLPHTGPRFRSSRRADGMSPPFVRQTIFQQRLHTPRSIAYMERQRWHRAPSEQENQFNPIALGLDAELRSWRADMSNGTMSDGLRTTPPREGRYDQYLQ